LGGVDQNNGEEKKIRKQLIQKGEKQKLYLVSRLTDGERVKHAPPRKADSQHAHRNAEGETAIHPQHRQWAWGGGAECGKGRLTVGFPGEFLTALWTGGLLSTSQPPQAIMWEGKKRSDFPKGLGKL